MTPEHLQFRWLTLRAFLDACVMPVTLVVLGLLFLASVLGLRGETLDALAGALAALGVMLCGVQGIDRVTARLTHHRMMVRNERGYRMQLKAVTSEPETLREAVDLIDFIDRELA